MKISIRALAVAAKNSLLRVFQVSLIDVLFQSIYNVRWQEEDKQSMLSHHGKIAERVANKDPEGAREAMIEHLKDMQSFFSCLPLGQALKWIK